MTPLTSTVENSLIFHESDSHNATMFTTFNMILQAVTQSYNRDELIVAMNNIFQSSIMGRYFEYGFGGSHMWLVQKPLGGDEVKFTKERVLIVKFD